MNILKFAGLMLILGTEMGVSATVSAGEADPDIAQTHYQLKFQMVPKMHYADGVIEAVKQATVSAQTVGRITEINFDVDDFVPKGSVLLRFRNNKQKAALVEAQASVKEVETRLEETNLEFERIKGVFSKKLVSKSVYDKASANYQAANQRLGQVRARLTQAQEEFDRTIVRAPYAGIVVKRHVEVGETAKIGQALFTGFSMDSMRVVANVPQSVVNLISRGISEDQKTYIVYPDGIGRKPNNGSLTSSLTSSLTKYRKVAAKKVTINPYGDPVTHAFGVRVQLPSGLQGIYPGMFIKVAFIVGEQKRLLVPQQAIVNRSEVTAVYVMAPEGGVSFRQIRVGNELLEGYVEALSGLQEGEQVVLDPVQAGERLKAQRTSPGSRSASGNGT